MQEARSDAGSYRGPIDARDDWPRKTRELHNQFMDSTVWNYFRFRPDDVVIASYAKAGTTWTQQIVGQLIFGGRPDVDVAALSPWVDLRITPKAEKLAAIEAQRNRRFLKTHLPADALVFSPEAKYIYVGRDGRDIVWSYHHHHSSANDAFFRAINDTPGRVGGRIAPATGSVRWFFLDWLCGDGYPIWSLWENVASWWAIRHLPNVLLLHYADMKADVPGTVRRIADFLDITPDAATFEAVLRHVSFEHMKATAGLSVPRGGSWLKGGPQTFFHSGTNGRWRGTLTEEDCRLYEEIARRRLGPACARWLANGAAATARAGDSATGDEIGAAAEGRSFPAADRFDAFRAATGLLAAVGRRLLAWDARYRQRHRLAELPGELLADIGLSRREAAAGRPDRRDLRYQDYSDG